MLKGYTIKHLQFAKGQNIQIDPTGLGIVQGIYSQSFVQFLGIY